MNFSSLHVDTPLASNINGLAIPGPETVSVNNPAMIGTPKVFQQTSSIGKMNVIDSLNGLRVIPDCASGWQNQLDILVKSIPQTVFGKKTFSSLRLDGHSLVGGLINGVDILKLADKFVKLNATQEFPGTWVFSRAEFHGPLEVLGNIEGLNFAELFHRALKLSQPLPSHSTAVFKELVQMEFMNSPNINGLDISKDLVTKDGDHVIRGTKVFSEAFLASNSILHGLANSINLAFLHDCMLTHGDQVFLQPKQIANDLIVTNLMVGGINGIPFGSFVSLKNDEVLFGAPEFVNMIVQKPLQTLSLKFSGRINNETFENLIQDTMTYTEHQDVLGHKTILGNLTTIVNSNVDTPNLNGIDFGALAEDLVYHDRPQTVKGKKTFRGLTHFDHLNFFGSLDGVTHWDMMHNWMLQDVAQTIAGDLIVNGDVFVNSYISSWHINGLDIGHLNNSIVKVNEPAELQGPIHMKDATVEQGLRLTGKIQGIDLSEDAVLHSRDNVIWGHKHYTNGLEIGGQMRVKGYVDGVKISELCEHAVRLHGNHHLKSLTINGNLEVPGLAVGGLLDGVDLVLLNATAMKLNQAIDNEHAFTFDTLHVTGPLTVHGLLNGIDMTYLMNSYLSVSKDQNVDALISFKSPVFVKSALIIGDMTTADKLLNGIDIGILSNSVFRTVGDQMVQVKYIFADGMVFERDLHAKRINGLAIPDDLMLKRRENVVLGPVAFEQDFHVHGDLNLGNGVLLQNVDVQDWAWNAIYKQGNFNITGPKEFGNSAIDHPRFYNTLNGMTISPETVMLTFGNQMLHGNTLFGKSVLTNGNAYVGGLVNGINMEQFQRDAVNRNSENVISGVKTFAAPIKADELRLHGNMNGINLTDLNRKIGMSHILDGIGHEIHALESQIAEIGALLQEQAVSFAYYDLIQEWRHAQIRNWHFLPIYKDMELLFIADSKQDQSACSAVHILQYDLSSGYFIPFSGQASILANYAVDVKSAVTDRDVLVFVGNSNPVSCNQHQFGALHIYRWNTKGFDLIQVVEDLPIRSLAVINLHEHVCVAAHVHNLYNDHPLHIYCNDQSAFRLVQKVESPGINYITSMTCKNKPLLVATRKFGTEIYIPTGSPSLTPLEILQKIPGMAVKVSCTSDAEHCYLAVSSESRLSVYRFDEHEGRFVLIQKWELDDIILSMQWTTLPSHRKQLFLIVLTRSSQHNLQVFRFQGASGFMPYLSLTSLDAVDIYVFARPHSMEHYLAVIHETCINDFWHQAGSWGILLASKIKGR